MGIVLGFIFMMILIMNWFNQNEKETKIKQQQKKFAEEESLSIIAGRQKTASLLLEFRRSIYRFGYKNKKVESSYYDIEEGGDYLTDFDKYDKLAVDKIVDEELKVQSRYFFEDPKYVSMFPTTVTSNTRQWIEKRILNELPTKTSSSDNHIGF